MTMLERRPGPPSNLAETDVLRTGTSAGLYTGVGINEEDIRAAIPELYDPFQPEEPNRTGIHEAPNKGLLSDVDLAISAFSRQREIESRHTRRTSSYQPTPYGRLVASLCDDPDQPAIRAELDKMSRPLTPDSVAWVIGHEAANLVARGEVSLPSVEAPHEIM